MKTCQSANAKLQQEQPGEAVKSMANGLPEKDSVRWASASAKKVSNPANVEDMNAIHAADTWAANPCDETRQAAGLAAAKTNFQTPGAWAAQGAAWSGAGAGLTSHAVSGAVMLAAAQGGKPIPPSPSAPALSGPQFKAPQFKAPQTPQLKAPSIAKPSIPGPPPAPEVPVTGPDGLTLTPSQRTEMTQNTKPFIDMGCDIESGKA